MTRLFLNNHNRRPPWLTARAQSITRLISAPTMAESIWNRLAAYDGFAPTPLLSLDKLAAGIGIGTLYAKDERERWNQGSFKALGGTYAVLSAAGFRAADTGRVFATFSAGNHGRAVAYGAALAGANAKVFLPRGVPAGQRQAILDLGAEVIDVAGDYEHAAEECRRHSAEEGWTVVADSGSEGDEAMPARVMQGYTVMALEIREELRQPPTHVFVQAGVGSLAASLTGYFVANVTPAPRCVVVEPEAAACVCESVRHLQHMTIAAAPPTRMGRLQCRIASTLAWPVLAHNAEAFVAIDDAMAEGAARVLEDEGLATTASGAAGLAGLLEIAGNDAARQAIGLNAASRVLIALTEQDTQEGE